MKCSISTQWSIISYNRKELSSDTCYNIDEPLNIMLSERSQSQKSIYCMTLCIRNVWISKSRDRKKITVCQGLEGKGNREWPLMGMGFLFGEMFKLIVVMAAQSCEYTKKLYWTFWKGELYDMWIISQKKKLRQKQNKNIIDNMKTNKHGCVPIKHLQN